MRPSKNEYYLDIAKAVARRSTCLRRQYGAVIVNHDEIIATGYNGAPRGDEDCLYNGICWREENDIPHGAMYEMCISVHAEQNAIISAARSEMIGGTLYLAGFENGREIVGPEPCVICSRMIQNSGIKEVITNCGREANLIKTLCQA